MLLRLPDNNDEHPQNIPKIFGGKKTKNKIKRNNVSLTCILKTKMYYGCL